MRWLVVACLVCVLAAHVRADCESCPSTDDSTITTGTCSNGTCLSCRNTQLTPPKCFGCDPGYFTSDFSGTCKLCPDLLWVYILVAVVLMVAGTLVLMKFARSGTHYMTSISVGFNFFQVVAVFATLSLTWQTELAKLFSLAASVNLDISVIQFNCIAHDSLGQPFQVQWFAKLFFPLFFIPIFFLSYCILYLYLTIKGKCQERSLHAAVVMEEEELYNEFGEKVAVADSTTTRVTKSRRKRTILRQVVVNAYLSLLTLLYINLLTTSLEVFECQRQSDGTYRKTFTNDNGVVVVSPSVCYTDGSASTIVNIAYLALIVYGGGIPLTIFAILRYHKDKLHFEATILKFGLLYRKYSLSTHLWELLIILRKVLIVIVRLIPTTPAKRCLAIVGVLVVSLVLQIGLSPYQVARVNRLEWINLGGLILVGASGVVFYSNNEFSIWDHPDTRIGQLIIIVSVAFCTAAIVFTILYDVRHSFRMRSHGLVGGYANEDVQVYQHFFNSNFTVCGETNYVTTTNHYNDIVFMYPPSTDAKEKVVMEIKLQAPRKLIQQLQQKHAKTEDYGDVSIQHDRVAHKYYINGLFPIKGTYLLRLSGGRVIEVAEGCCSDQKKVINDVWHVKRRLMDYQLVVTEGCGKGQKFVNLRECAQSGCVLFQPMAKYLAAGESVLFRLRAPGAKAVKVMRFDKETRLVKEAGGNETFSGEVQMPTNGHIYVNVLYPLTNNYNPTQTIAEQTHRRSTGRRLHRSNSGLQLDEINLEGTEVEVLRYSVVDRHQITTDADLRRKSANRRATGASAPRQQDSTPTDEPPSPSNETTDVPEDSDSDSDDDLPAPPTPQGHHVRPGDDALFGVHMGDMGPPPSLDLGPPPPVPHQHQHAHHGSDGHHHGHHGSDGQPLRAPPPPLALETYDTTVVHHDRPHVDYRQPHHGGHALNVAPEGGERRGSRIAPPPALDVPGVDRRGSHIGAPPPVSEYPTMIVNDAPPQYQQGAPQPHLLGVQNQQRRPSSPGIQPATNMESAYPTMIVRDPSPVPNQHLLAAQQAEPRRPSIVVPPFDSNARATPVSDASPRDPTENSALLAPASASHGSSSSIPESPVQPRAPPGLVPMLISPPEPPPAFEDDDLDLPPPPDAPPAFHVSLRPGSDSE